MTWRQMSGVGVRRVVHHLFKREREPLADYPQNTGYFANLAEFGRKPASDSAQIQKIDDSTEFRNLPYHSLLIPYHSLGEFYNRTAPSHSLGESNKW